LPAVAAGFGSLNDSSPAELLKAREEFFQDVRHGQQLEFWTKQTQAKNTAERELAYGVLLTFTMNQLAPEAERKRATAEIEKGWDSQENTVSLLKAIGLTYADHLAPQVKSKLQDGRADVKEAAVYAAKMIDLDNIVNRVGPFVAKMAYDEIVAAVTKEKGNAKLGSRLFFKQGCMACHTTSPQESPRGPMLADITTRYKQEEILESILKPSAKIAQGFETQFFQLNDGKILEGFVTRESGTEVEIRNLTGAVTIIPKKDIEQRGRREISMMPERLVENLTVQELASIWAYLDTLRSKAK
jgi:putative heme-binding domain-containing protein